MTTDTDFAALIEPVARHFWGEPNAKLSSKTELRWGGQGSRAVFLDGVGNWKDFEGGNDDGTVIALVMAEMKCDKSSALRWLEGQNFIPKRDSGHSAPHQRQERPAPINEPEEPPAPPRDDEIEYEVEHEDYSNRDGEFQYRVVRYQFRRPDGSVVIDAESGKPKKTFKQKSRDAQGRITFGLNGRAPCLYRWPSIEQAIAEGKTVVIAEGERAARAVLGLGWESTTNSGGAGNNFTDEMVATFRGAHVVILPDNDPQATKKVRTRSESGEVTETRELRFHKDGRPVFPGQDHAEAVAAKLRGIAASVKVLSLPGLPLKGDIVEWIAAGGTAEQLQALIDRCPAWRPSPPVSRFGAQRMSQIANQPLVFDWLIKHLVERSGVLIVAGESQAGKSFFVLDMGMKIARGLEYAGRKTLSGAVIHMASEDGNGTKLRVEGYRKANGISPDMDVPYIVMDPHAKGAQGFSLMSDESVDAFIGECLEWKRHYGSLELVIIDTVSAAAEGLDENSSAEVTKMLTRVNRVRDMTGATVCLVHHMNAAATRIRGSSALVANVANVIEVRPMMTIPKRKDDKPEIIKDSDGRPMRRAILTKNKNGLNDVKWTFVLQEVAVGLDQDGEQQTTCICAKAARQRDEPEERQKMSPDTQLVFDALQAAMVDSGQDMPAGVAKGASVKRCAPQGAFEANVRKTMTFTASEDEIEARNKELAMFIKRTTTGLINAGYMGRDNDLKICWWTGKSAERRPRYQEPDRPQEQPGAGVPENVMQEIQNDPVPF